MKCHLDSLVSNRPHVMAGGLPFYLTQCDYDWLKHVSELASHSWGIPLRSRIPSRPFQVLAHIGSRTRLMTLLYERMSIIHYLGVPELQGALTPVCGRLANTTYHRGRPSRDYGRAACHVIDGLP